MRVPLWLLLLASPATVSGLQGEVTLRGRVVDGADGGTVSQAHVQVSGVRAVRTDGFGRFNIARVPVGRREIRVRMLGYRPFVDSTDVAAGDSIPRELVLQRVPNMLTQMTIRGKAMRVPAGFESVYRRAERSRGTFITRERIDSLLAPDITALLRSEANIHITPQGRALSTPRCKNWQVQLNGVPMSHPESIGEIMRHMAPSSVQAIEIYEGIGRVPPDLARGQVCGVMGVWTRKG